jgi:hypothetical protein
MTIGATKYGCKIELSKTDGITISIRDLSQPDQVYKQVLLQGDSLVIKTNKLTSSATITQTESSVVTEVKDATGSTKIEQGPEEVKVTCKKWTLDAETITVTSSQDTSYTATGAYSVTSTKDFKVDTQATCTLKSLGAMTLDATAAATYKSAAQLDVQAPKIGLTADASLEATSSGALNLKGGAVSVKGDMRAELDSPSTTVGSAMTTVSGQIVSISGSLIKLG